MCAGKSITPFIGRGKKIFLCSLRFDLTQVNRLNIWSESVKQTQTQSDLICGNPKTHSNPFSKQGHMSV